MNKTVLKIGVFIMTVSTSFDSIGRAHSLSTIFEETNFKEKYTILNEIAQGTHSTVFLCKDRMGKLVAAKQYIVRDPDTLKLTEEAGFDKEKFVKNLACEEWEMSNRIHHPNILTIKEVIIDDSVPYVIMDYVDGITIDQYKPESKQSSNRLGYQLLDVIEYLLSRSIIIDDLWSENIFITKNDDLMLIDLGGFIGIDQNDDMSLSTYIEEIETYLENLDTDISRDVLKSYREVFPKELLDGYKTISPDHTRMLIHWVQSLKRHIYQPLTTEL